MAFEELFLETISKARFFKFFSLVGDDKCVKYFLLFAMLRLCPLVTIPLFYYYCGISSDYASVWE